MNEAQAKKVAGLLRIVGINPDDLNPAALLDHPLTGELVERIARRTAELVHDDGPDEAAAEPSVEEEP